MLQVFLPHQPHSFFGSFWWTEFVSSLQRVDLSHWKTDVCLQFSRQHTLDEERRGESHASNGIIYTSKAVHLYTAKASLRDASQAMQYLYALRYNHSSKEEKNKTKKLKQCDDRVIIFNLTRNHVKTIYSVFLQSRKHLLILNLISVSQIGIG